VDTDHILILDVALYRDTWLTVVGSMRCRQLGRAMHKLRSILHRMQNPDAETEEDGYWEGKGFG
jgi:hypothetical protein